MKNQIKNGLSMIVAMSMVSLSLGQISYANAGASAGQAQLSPSVRVQLDLLNRHLQVETANAQVYATRVKLIEDYSSEKGLPLYVTHRTELLLGAMAASNTAVGIYLIRKGILKSTLSKIMGENVMGGVALIFMMAVIGAPAAGLVLAITPNDTYYKQISSITDSAKLRTEYDSQVLAAANATESIASLKNQIDALSGQ